MKLEMFKWTTIDGWSNLGADLADRNSCNLALVFGSSELIADPERFKEIRGRYPNAILAGCSTSGNIAGTTVDDESIVVTGVCLEKSKVRLASRKIQGPEGSFDVGKAIMQELTDPELKHVLFLSEGLNVNGSSLAEGANSADCGSVQVTGGLAGDGTNFKITRTMANANAEPNQVVALGFYGESFRVSHSCVHGWEAFGVNRRISKSKGNVVYEIDGEPALALYKRYLGEENARNLPASGLRFPLRVVLQKTGETVIRTLLAVDEKAQTLTFAGDVSEGNAAVLMKTNMDGLISAAGHAAATARLMGDHQGLAVAISCVGRRLVLSKLVEEEICAVSDTLGENTLITGFYSYGELAPNMEQGRCNLHNQTMTLTTMSE